MTRAIILVSLIFPLTVLALGNETFFDNRDAILDRLAYHGFENLRIRSNDQGIPVIYYENRIYRDELYAVAVVLAETEDLLPDSGFVILTPSRRALPICGLCISISLYKAWMHDEFSEPPAGWIRLQNASERIPLFGANARARSLGRFDLMLNPSFSLYLGNYDDRFKLFLQLLPTLSTTLWRGAGIFIEGSFPLYNDVNYQYYRFKEYSQVSKAGLNQMMRLPGDVLASVSMGVFNPNRWGIGGEATKLLLDRHLAIGYRFEYTGFMLYYNKMLNYSRINLITSQTYAVYYFNPLNVQVGASYNRYVMKDSGWLFELSRNFRETNIGAFAGSTQFDKFGGIMLKFAFSRKKQSTPAVLRVVLPHYYEYSYRATNVVYTQHEPIQTGIPVYAGTRLTSLYTNLTPNYIAQNLFLFESAYHHKLNREDKKERVPDSLWRKFNQNN